MGQTSGASVHMTKTKTEFQVSGTSPSGEGGVHGEDRADMHRLLPNKETVD